MSYPKKKGYRTERKIKMILEKYGWKVIRTGASLGEADLICIKKGKCILLQIKSTKKKVLYYYDYMKNKIEGFPFYVLIDFGYGKIRISKPKTKIKIYEGEDFKNFLEKL
ncbi:MAG: hypothetical protein NC899_07750 [Candidatus Omnitrophica bacterium]|nr:hypothetical protein [Candidatus Omnitrophota bacterium]